MNKPLTFVCTAAAAFVAAASLSDCSNEVNSGGGVTLEAPAQDPTDFGPIPDFELTDQLGRKVTRADLAGRPFVLAAIFSTCTGPCPRISGHMKALQSELASTDALLVSVTVDPGHDTSEVLREYAEGFGADPERWRFLTGEEEAVYTLVREGFYLAVERDSDDVDGQQVTHATRLIVVDGEGLRRGWYDGTSDAGRAAVRERVRFLAGEKK